MIQTQNNCHHLPFYPLPDVRDSLTFLCNCTQPLSQSPEDQNDLELLADAFLKDEGEQAQSLLRKIQQERLDRNWLHDFWLDDYLNIHTPLGSTSNFVVEFSLPDLSVETPHLAARLVRAVVATYLSLQEKDVPIPNGREDYDHHQILGIFGSTRVPGRHRDHLVQNKSHYITIYYRGNCYSLEVIKDGYPTSLVSLEENIRQIYHSNKAKATNLHSLASYLPFSESQKLYQRLQEITPEYCEVVEGSLWNLVLLDDDPVTLQDKAYQILFGLKDTHQANIKKSATFFLTPSHSLYLNCEHTVADALSHVMIIEESMKRFMDDDTKECLPSTLQYHHLPSLKEGERAFAIYEKACRHILFTALTLDFPTKDFKSRGISVDGLLQFGFHYAYYCTFGECKSAYESVSVAHFQGARTDGLRSLSVPSKAFVLDLVKNNKVDFEKLKAASNFHKEMIKKSKLGLNHLRHIYALQKVSSHRLFQHSLVKELFTDTISTSTVGKHPLFFASATSESIGIAYAIHSTQMYLNMSYYPDFPIETYCSFLHQYRDRLVDCIS